MTPDSTDSKKKETTKPAEPGARQGRPSRGRRYGRPRIRTSGKASEPSSVRDGQNPPSAEPSADRKPGDAPNSPSSSDGVPARTGGQPARPGKRRGRKRLGAPRAKLPTQRRLPPTTVHANRTGVPKGQEDTADKLRIIALGGLGEIGKNCYLLEYKDDIILIDAGIMFPEYDMPGIDFLIPNTEYLEGKKDKLRGLLLTHGHLDHVGAIPYLQNKLGNPDIYTAALTKGIVLKRHAEFSHLPKLPIHVVKSGDVVKLGDYFEVEFFHMNHNIPDDLGIMVRTPVGNIIHTADFKFDPNPVNDKPVDLENLKTFGDEGILALLCDSTDAETPGKSISEETIMENLEIIFKEATGMLVTATFSSMVNRMQQLIQLSEKYGRKVAFAGYALKSNMEIAKELGYVKMEKGTEIDIAQVNDYPRESVTVIATGAQGEDNAALMRIVNREHRHVTITPHDTVVFSSSVIPGNERTVQRLKDMLYRTGVKVFHYKMMDIHAGGHARQEDLKEILELLRPKYLMPIHGQYSMMVTLGELGVEKGVEPENVIVADNSHIVNITPDTWWFDKDKAPDAMVLVDGLGVGDVSTVVLRDRQVLAEDGMFTIILVLDPRTGRIRTSPDIISRGFIYLKEQKDLLAQVRRRIRTLVESEKARPINSAYLKDQIRDDIGQFLFQKTERRPMVLPVIIEI